MINLKMTHSKYIYWAGWESEVISTPTIVIDVKVEAQRKKVQLLEWERRTRQRGTTAGPRNLAMELYCDRDRVELPRGQGPIELRLVELS